MKSRVYFNVVKSFVLIIDWNSSSLSFIDMNFNFLMEPTIVAIEAIIEH